MRKDFKTGDEYLAALDTHFTYMSIQRNRAKRMKDDPSILNSKNIIFVEGAKSKISVMYDNLVSYACYAGKRIIKICRQEFNGTVIITAQIE